MRSRKVGRAKLALCRVIRLLDLGERHCSDRRLGGSVVDLASFPESNHHRAADHARVLK